MPIVNQERWSHIQFFSQHEFLELGTTSSGAKIIQIGKEADEPILLQLCGEVRNPDGSFVSQEGIKKLRCSDLIAIDDLWLKYSNGRFGYSVQQRIWQSLGGTRKTKIEDRHDELWNSFCKRVRWHTAFPVLTFTLKAPEGHLPAIIAWGIGCSPALLGEVYASLFSRIEDCKF